MPCLRSATKVAAGDYSWDDHYGVRHADPDFDAFRRARPESDPDSTGLCAKLGATCLGPRPVQVLEVGGVGDAA
jgi:hypothetical protein